jgi:glycosyltransferase involved in cell wall biosynthesis
MNDKKTKPKVSACLISYNLENLVAGAIDGALMQKLDYPYEIVIGDDVSKDGTREILLDYQKKYPDKIRVILNEKNLGVAGNLISTINACRGEYVAFCDGDDYWTDPLKLQIQVDELEKHPECDISFHPAVIKYMDGSRPDGGKAYYGKGIKIFDTRKNILIGGSFCPTASLVFHKKVLDELVKFHTDLRSSSDYFLEIFGSLRGGLLYVGRYMSVYRFAVSGSFTAQNKKFGYTIEHTKETEFMLRKLDKYLNYKFTKEINYKITLTNYTVWRQFIKLNKKDLDDYENIKKEMSGLKMNKTILAGIILKSIVNKMKLKRFFTLIFYRHVYEKVMNVWLVALYHLPYTSYKFSRKLLHKFGVHWYYKWSSQCLSFIEMDKLDDSNKYSFRKCKLCDKEMPHSRHFFKTGVKEKNAKIYIYENRTL